MNKIRQVPANHEIEVLIGNLLRACVIVSAATVFVGGVIYLIHHGAAVACYHVFEHEPSYLCNVKGILGDAASFHGRGLIQLGLLLLIATPIMRVTLSFFVFLRQRDTLYAIITSIVFCVLMYSILNQ